MNERIGMLFGLMGVVFFGLTLPATRAAIVGLDPWLVGLGRGLIAAIPAAVLLAATRQKWPPRSTWPFLAITAGGVVLGFPLLATLAMQYVPASHGGVMLAILPLATAAAGVLFAGERPSIGFRACAVAGTAAVLAFALIEDAAAGGIQYADILLLAAVAVTGIGYATGAQLSRTMEGWQVISWALVLTAPVLALILWFRGTPVNWDAPASAWFGFFYVALGSQFIAFFVWYKGLALGGVARVGQLQLLQPFVTLAAAAALLGEHIGWLEIGFATLVVAIVSAGRRMHVQRRT